MFQTRFNIHRDRLFISAFLPIPHLARHNAEERMRLRLRDVSESESEIRSARLKFDPQMFPLVEQLSARLGNFSAEPRTRDFAGVEAIAASLRFLRETGEKRRKRRTRITLHLKANQLRMISITFRPARENLLRQQ